MINFISAEEFLEQSEKVQKCFREWCELNLQEYDLVKPEGQDDICIVTEVKDTRKDNIDIGRVFYLGNCPCFDSIYELVPILQMHHLVKFIEDKVGRKINIENFSGGYEIADYSDLGHDLLQALFTVACRIAEGEEK